MLKLQKNVRRRFRKAYLRTRRLVRRIEIRAHHVRRGSLIAGALVAGLVFFVLGAGLRLLIGPISLAPFKGEISDSLADALPGVAVRFDDAALEWSRDEGRINIVILGARLFDADQRIIAQAPKAEIDLAAGPFIQGDIQIRRIALVGVQLTLVRTSEGKLRLGVERDKEQGDVLQRIRDALSRNNGPTSLETFGVRHARLAFFDESSGLFVVSPNANLQVSTGERSTTAKPQTKKAGVSAAIDADVEISGRSAHVLGNMELPDEGPVKANISVKGLSLRALGENARSFASLKSFDLATDLSASLTIVNGKSLRDADFGIGARGKIEGLGAPLEVKDLRVVGRYDGRTGRYLIDEATLQGKQLAAHASGGGNIRFDASGAFENASIELTGDKISFDMPEELSNSVSLAKLEFRASYSEPDRSIAIEKFALFGGPLLAELSGHIGFDPEKSPSVELQGQIGEINIRDLLRYWPFGLAGGAREWIDANIPAGRLGPVEIRTNIAPGDLDLPALPDAALSVTSAVRDATVVYLHGLTVATNTQGTLALSGDNFRADVTSASIGQLTVPAAHVKIAELHLPTTKAQIDATIQGPLRNILNLVDLPPLQYPSRFHLKPDSAAGNVTANLTVVVPTERDVNVDDVSVGVNASVSGFGMALSDTLKVSNGDTNFEIDNRHLHASGNVDFSGSRVAVDWVEDFKPVGEISTHIVVKGTVADDARAALNFRAGDILAGPVGVVADIEGKRGILQKAHMIMDLAPATVSVDIINFRKPPGTAATADISALFNNDGDIASESMTISGSGIDIRGSAAFDADGNLQNLNLPVVKAGQANDFALDMSDTPAGLNVLVTGNSADGTALGKRDTKSSEGPETKVASRQPFHITARLNHVVMRSGVTISPLAFEVSGQGDMPQTMSLSANLSNTARLVGSVTSSGTGRKVMMSSNDAGLIIQGLFGLTSIKGGKLDINATLPAMAAAIKGDPNTPDYSGTIDMKSFKVAEQPFLTRLFAAGSLGGLAGLMRGEGIAIDTMQVPFTSKAGVVSIREARASGPSIGITTEGFIDRRRNQIGLRGAIAPLYGINSVLGAIPLLGDLLISKKGEGILGMTYSVNGNADEPKISMNPLSILTPGILRRIFQGKMPVPKPVQQPETPNPPKQQNGTTAVPAPKPPTP